MLPNLCVFIGAYGSGKSLSMVEAALKLANDCQKKLISNLPLNLKAVKQYCLAAKLNWFAYNGRVKFCNLSIQSLLSILEPDSVVALDELGTHMNARFWATVSKEFLDAANTLRHSNIHLLCTFQFLEQVDKNIREQAQHFVLCRGISTGYNRRLGMPKLLIRIDYHLNKYKFWAIQFDNQIMAGGIKLWFRSLKVYWRVLFINDLINEISNFIPAIKAVLRKKVFQPNQTYEQLLFKVYNSSQNRRVIPVAKSEIVYVTLPPAPVRSTRVRVGGGRIA
jgi:hypothetical protein